MSKSYELILTKNGLGYILGDIFTNSSGHAGQGLELKNVYLFFFLLLLKPFIPIVLSRSLPC
jgi:hypothetical protein